MGESVVAGIERALADPGELALERTRSPATWSVTWTGTRPNGWWTRS